MIVCKFFAFYFHQKSVKVFSIIFENKKPGKPYGYRVNQSLLQHNLLCTYATF